MKTQFLTFFKKWGLISAFIASSSRAFAAGNDYRAYVMSLPTHYSFYHEAIDRQYVINVQVEITGFLDPETVSYEVNSGSYKFAEFFERTRLSKNSFVEVSGRRLPLTCLWIYGQRNMSSEGTKTFLRRVFFVINNEDCQGPVTDLGDDRWDSFIELTVYNPTLNTLKEGRLVLNGNGLALGLAPLEWQEERLP